MTTLTVPDRALAGKHDAQLRALPLKFRLVGLLHKIAQFLVAGLPEGVDRGALAEEVVDEGGPPVPVVQQVRLETGLLHHHDVVDARHAAARTRGLPSVFQPAV